MIDPSELIELIRSHKWIDNPNYLSSWMEPTIGIKLRVSQNIGTEATWEVYLDGWTVRRGGVAGVNECKTICVEAAVDVIVKLLTPK